MSYFVTGTDTGVGKTRFSCLLIEALRAEGRDVVGYKPVCSGDREDAVLLANASGGLDLDQVNPVWLKAAVAPLVAGMLENRPVNPAVLLEGFRALAAEHAGVIVEGAGGWRDLLHEALFLDGEGWVDWCDGGAPARIAAVVEQVVARERAA